jgi:hypothetical protein
MTNLYNSQFGESPSDDQTHIDDLRSRLEEMVDAENASVIPSVLTERVMRAVRDQHISVWRFDDLWSAFVVGWFRPVAVLGILLVVFLALFNVRQFKSDVSEQSTTEAVLGLQPVTVAVAYEYEIASISR